MLQIKRTKMTEAADVGKKRKFDGALNPSSSPASLRRRIEPAPANSTNAGAKESNDDGKPAHQSDEQGKAHITRSATSSQKTYSSGYPECKPPPPKSRLRPRNGGEPYFWKDALTIVAMNYEQVDESSIYYVDSEVVVIYDGYPKSKIHLLVIPRYVIKSLKEVCERDMNTLKYMTKVAKNISEWLKISKKVHTRIGYHAIPSMPQLHLHIISDDFDSECLKTKRHYQSFTTGFFIDPDIVLEMVEKRGKVSVDSGMENVLKGDMRCLHCGRLLKNMPKLRSHLSKCSSRK